MPLRLIGKDKIALKSADGKHIYIFCSYCSRIIKRGKVHFDGDLCLEKKKEFDKAKKSAGDAVDYFKKRIFDGDYYTKFLSKKDIKEIEEQLEKLRGALLGKNWRIA